MQDLNIFQLKTGKLTMYIFVKVLLQQGTPGIYTFFVSEGDRGVPDVMYPSSLACSESVTCEIEGKENKVAKSIDFIIQSCSNFQGISTRCHIMKCFSIEQNRFSHLKVTAQYSSVAFLLPLSVCYQGQFPLNYKTHWSFWSVSL